MNVLLPLGNLWKGISRPTETCHAQSLTKLGKRTVISRTLLPGETLQCIRGQLWITASHHPGDIILREGEQYLAPRRTRLLIEALDDSTLHG